MKTISLSNDSILLFFEVKKSSHSPSTDNSRCDTYQFSWILHASAKQNEKREINRSLTPAIRTIRMHVSNNRNQKWINPQQNNKQTKKEGKNTKVVKSDTRERERGGEKSKLKRNNIVINRYFNLSIIYYYVTWISKRLFNMIDCYSTSYLFWTNIDDAYIQQPNTNNTSHRWYAHIIFNKMHCFVYLRIGMPIRVPSRNNKKYKKTTTSRKWNTQKTKSNKIKSQLKFFNGIDFYLHIEAFKAKTKWEIIKTEKSNKS